MMKLLAHGNDMHASQMSAGNFESVNPGETSMYCYIAESAGVFKYHCSGVKLIGMDQHVLSGMYGIAIVDPVNGYKKLMVEKTAVEIGGEVSLDRHVLRCRRIRVSTPIQSIVFERPDGNYDATAMFATSKHRNSR